MLITRLSALVIALSCLPTHAEENSPPNIDLFDLELSELLQIEVSVASTESESISETPAVVSRYEVADLERLGLHSLEDFLSFIPGVVIQKPRHGKSTVMVRGIAEAFNQKMLLLIDGVPYWMPSHSAAPMLGIPFQAISHIEVIRGPGAVHYGSNASAGVISVVTKENADNNLALTVGSNEFINHSGFVNKQFDEGFLALSYESQRESGYKSRFENLPISRPGLEANGDLVVSEEMDSMLVRGGYRSFNFLAQAYQSISSDFPKQEPVLLNDELEYKGYILHGRYTYAREDNEVTLFTDYNNHYAVFNIMNVITNGEDGGFHFEDDGAKNYRWRNGVNWNYRGSDSLSFFSGIEYEERSTGDYDLFTDPGENDLFNLMEADKTHETSAYFQADYSLDQWRLLLGGRYVDNSLAGEDLSPRLALIYNIDDSSSIKLLHADGFNSPNFIQQSINTPSIKGNPNLVSERISTTDLAYSYSTPSKLFVANIYYLEAKDFIERAAVDNQVSYSNKGNFDRYGIELDYQFKSYQWTLFSNMAYNHQGNRTISGDANAFAAPRYTLSLGNSYNLNASQSLGGSIRHVSERGAAAGFTRLNLHYQYRFDQLQAWLSVINLLDQSVVYADTFDFSPSHTVEGEHSVGVKVGVTYHF